MTSDLNTFWIVMVVSTLTTWVLARFGKDFLLDHPNDRSSHSIPTPRSGGVAIVTALALGIGLSGSGVLLSAAPAIAGIAILSFFDDLRGLPTRLRLVAHLILSVFVVSELGAFAAITVPGMVTLTSTPVLGVLSVIWLVGLINAYNFMDGIDGIAAAQAIIAGVAWTWLGSEFDAPLVATAGMILAAAATGFLMFNIPPARIFMGDVGSATLGFVLGLIPLMGMHENGTATWIPAAAVLIVWPFLFDTLFTMGRRFRRGEPVWKAHRSHLYQRLVIAGWPHLGVTGLYAVLSALNARAALALAAGDRGWSWLSAVATCAALLMITSRAEAQAFKASIFHDVPASRSSESGS